MKKRTSKDAGRALALAVALHFALPVCAAHAEESAGGGTPLQTDAVNVEADAAKEEAKYESQSTTIITKEDIARKQAKSVEDVIFNEVGVTRTIDAMGNVGVSIRGGDPRHTLLMVDGQRVLGGEAKYNGNGDELLRIGAENIERIEIIRGAASAKYGADAIGGVIHVITKQGVKNPSVSLNIEGRYHSSRTGSGTETNTLPTNFFLRADSGDLGKLNLSAWVSKREVLPVYSGGKQFVMGENWYDDFKPSLRFYGSIKNDGVSGVYSFDNARKLTFRLTTEREDMQRHNKNVLYPLGSFFEPMQIYQRNRSRDTYSLGFEGRWSKKTDYSVSFGHGRMREDDSTVLSYYSGGHDKYAGKNSLAGVDWLEHRQTNLDFHFNTAANDAHYLSYGFGWQKEYAEGSRLKSASRVREVTINPWDYDKSLWVDDNTAGMDDKPDSYVHNHKFIRSDNGFIWDSNTEYYGSSTPPPLTYEEAKRINLTEYLMSGTISDPVLKAKFEAFNRLLREQNDLSDPKFADAPSMYLDDPVFGYYGLFESAGESYKKLKDMKFNGQYFGQEFERRANKIFVGEADLTKTYAYIQDTWQLSPKTILSPILRLDHSDRFGSHATFNLGMTHTLAPHRRFKANVGTGYAEPGLGELFYNWEMYGGTGRNHLGWYWIGNPDLKPEKSFNIDLSLEGENEKTYAKIGVFHNEISDYMTHYFTGQLIDFKFQSKTAKDYEPVADRIYSFKNLGKAKLTGIEAEVQHKFNRHWSAKLGYTYLRAINASDDELPSRLLDRPTHKFDVGVNYKDEAHGWRAAFWGSYYSNMLDSNSVKTDNLFEQDSHGNYIKKRGEYHEKSFGIWNLLIEKDLTKDFTVYAGVDNLFNHQDDDRAYHDRTFRFGMNAKFHDLGTIFGYSYARNAAGQLVDENGVPLKNIYGTDWFLRRPESATDDRKKGDLEVFGDYRIRSNTYRGENKAEMRETKETQADDAAARNYADRDGHGFEQRLRVGASYRIADKLDLKVIASTGAANDAAYSSSDNKSLAGAHIERAELTGSPDRWDWTLGRIHEPMGVTGYYFGREYDGMRVLYTANNTQLAFGVGDFSRTTGVSDSAYSHKEAAMIRRAPTLNELLGYYARTFRNSAGVDEHISNEPYPMPYDPKAKANYREKFNNAGKIQDANGNWVRDPSLTDAQIAEKKLEVVRELVGILKDIDAEMQRRADADPRETYRNQWNKVINRRRATSRVYYNLTQADIIIRRGDGTVHDLTQGEPLKDIPLSSYKRIRDGNIAGSPKYGGIEGLLQSENIKTMMDDVLKVYEDSGSTYETRDGRLLTRDEAIDHMFSSFVGNTATWYNRSKPWTDYKGKVHYGKTDGSTAWYNGTSKFFEALTKGVFDPLNDAPIPLPGAPVTFTQPGFLLKHDVIPKMEGAGFFKVRHQIGDHLGLELWALHSFGRGAEVKGEELRIASVLGLGSRLRLGPRAMLSFDCGVNRSDMGRYFHGGRDAAGKYTGGGTNPYFWILRLDYGIADMDLPGTWGAYFDYKNFEHGSFVGGTGADLPDRYLDGIRSFTAGISFVPAKNLLLEAAYTFGARSTQMRDTLYTPEHFRLGDYARFQLTYRF